MPRYRLKDGYLIDAINRTHRVSAANLRTTK